MGIFCDMSISSNFEPFWVDPVNFGSRTTLHRTSLWFEQNLGGASRINDSSARQDFLQNTSHVLSPGDYRLLGVQDLKAFIQMNRPINPGVLEGFGLDIAELLIVPSNAIKREFIPK